MKLTTHLLSNPLLTAAQRTEILALAEDLTPSVSQISHPRTHLEYCPHPSQMLIILFPSLLPQKISWTTPTTAAWQASPKVRRNGSKPNWEHIAEWMSSWCTIRLGSFPCMPKQSRNLKAKTPVMNPVPVWRLKLLWICTATSLADHGLCLQRHRVKPSKLSCEVGIPASTSDLITITVLELTELCTRVGHRSHLKSRLIYLRMLAYVFALELHLDFYQTTTLLYLRWMLFTQCLPFALGYRTWDLHPNGPSSEEIRYVCVFKSAH